ncbi:MAG: AraC family transcriptional regulator [Flavobacteriaceae bacterium]
MSSFDEVINEENFKIFRLENNLSETAHFQKVVSADLIQFHFGVKGGANFIFNQGNYVLPLRENLFLFLYNPQKELPVQLNLLPESGVISVFISIKKFHSLFSEQAGSIPFLSPENEQKKYYKEEKITSQMMVILNQLFSYNLSSPVRKMYFKGKIYELLSLFFGQSESGDLEQCPFLADEENVLKIRKAKDIILSRMAEPPTLQELADEVNISLKKLKMGFKQIYGDSVYGFLLDYKLEYARKLLDSGSYNVNEAGLKIGYSTSSHFIAAFKKKFGITPKKYLQSV